MENSTPEVYPSYKVKVDWRIWFPGKDVKDGLVEHGNRAYKIIEILCMDCRFQHIPVTPAMVSG